MNNNKRFSRTTLYSAVGAALLAAPWSSAFAAAPAENEVYSLEEIIVTARKRQESLQDTPVVISALSAKTLSDFSIESVEDIADFTPGLIADTQGNSAGGILFLRGVGSGSASPAIDQAVSLVIDDMQVGSLQIQRSAMIDMEAVQVYKGPQALFFGKNSPGGVLSIKTADPGEEFEAQLKTGYEFEAEEWFVQGTVSGPLSDTAAGRLVVRYTESDGFFDVESGSSFPSSVGGSLPEEESVFARGTLVLTPTDDLSIRAKLTYSDTEANTDGRATGQRIHCPLGAPQGSEAFKCEANNTVQYVDIAQGAIDVLAAQGIKTDVTGELQNEQLLAMVSVDYDINNEFTLSSVTGYYDVSDFQNSNSSFALAPALAVAPQDIEVQQFTQEFRLASELPSAVNFVTGVYYEQKEHDSNTTVPVDARLFGSPVSVWVVGGVTEFVQDTEAMSVFVDISWDITEDLELSGGARYSWEEKEFDGIAGYVGRAKETWEDVSPQVTLSYSVNEDWMLFASYREGFKSGGFDGAFQFTPRSPEQYEPESVEGFEVGAKGTLLNNTLQLNAAIFTNEYDELQLGLFDPETISLFTVNAAAAEITGAEVDFVWLTPVAGLQARGAITYLDSEFTDFRAPCWTGQAIAQGCHLDLADDAFTRQDLSGEPLNLAAEYVANLGLFYEQELSHFLLGLSLDVIYSDDYETSTTRTLKTTQDSYTKVDAAIRLSNIDDTWSVGLIGRNLTDEYLITDGGTAPFTGSGEGTAAAMPGDTIAFVSVGRTFSIEFEYNFR